MISAEGRVASAATRAGCRVELAADGSAGAVLTAACDVVNEVPRALLAALLDHHLAQRRGKPLGYIILGGTPDLGASITTINTRLALVGLASPGWDRRHGQHRGPALSLIRFVQSIGTARVVFPELASLLEARGLCVGLGPVQVATRARISDLPASARRALQAAGGAPADFVPAFGTLSFDLSSRPETGTCPSN